MTNRQETLWDLEPHTRAKHDILTYYLKAWFPAQSGVPRRLIYIDGFAGPGEYKGGEPGSPILALDVVLQHQLYSRITRPGMDLVFRFVEADTSRFRNLEQQLSTYSVPDNMHINLVPSTFEEDLTARLQVLDERNLQLAPSFVFVDPFGPTGFSMELMGRLATQPRSEVLINFSYQPLNQWFLQVPAKHPRLDELFGDDRWRPALQILNPRQKETFLVQQYQDALEERGWSGLGFRMVNKHNQTQYHLLFGTKHYLGMLLMKRAMWSVAPDGDFQYSDFSNPSQSRLFANTMDDVYSQELAQLMWQNRRDTRVPKQALLESETAYHPTCIERHLTRALQVLEYEYDPPRIVEVVKPDGSRRRAKSYPGGCIIQFAP